MSPSRLIAHPELVLQVDEVADIEKKLGARRAGQPLAYIVGEKEFYSEPFFVDERVLIPRPETEIVVEEAVKIIENNPERRLVLDMGTGSGAIGIMVAKLCDAHVLAVDASMGALTVASINARRHGMQERVRFLCSDLFEAINHRGRFSVVAANLPYVPTGALAGLMRDVREYEPMRALDGGPDGLAIYRRFLARVPRHLEEGGAVVMEVGGREQSEAVAALLEGRGMKSRVRKDLSGTERVVTGEWKR